MELFVLSETFRSGTILSETEVTAGDRLPARTAALSTCSLAAAAAACLGRTGEGVARSRGTCGGGITSERRGSGSEEGRAATVTRGLSGIVTRDTCHAADSVSHIIKPSSHRSCPGREVLGCNHNIFQEFILKTPPICLGPCQGVLLRVHISLTFTSPCKYSRVCLAKCPPAASVSSLCLVWLLIVIKVHFQRLIVGSLREIYFLFSPLHRTTLPLLLASASH